MIFYDFETSGLQPGDPIAVELLRSVYVELIPAGGILDRLARVGRRIAGKEIIQVAAVAVGPDWNELEFLERKLTFDLRRADPEALEMNSYDAAVWAKEAVTPDKAREEFSALLRRHQSLRLVSRKGSPYRTAVLAGHNVTRFDQGFLEAWFGDDYIPACYQQLDTLTLAAWWRQVVPGPKPTDLKLGTLASWFKIPHQDAHDALGDVRVNVQVARILLEEMKGI